MKRFDGEIKVKRRSNGTSLGIIIQILDVAKRAFDDVLVANDGD
jgi:hypothetical protein